jgi:tight adherence protein B
VRGRAAVCFAVVAAFAALASNATAQEEPRLTPAGGARFPDRAFVLSLPTGASLSQSDVQVRENGELVKNVSVVPAGAADSGQFAVVVVIDASRSMRGEAITGAVEAARAFAAQRGANQLMGIVTFNKKATVALPLTASQSDIAAALAAKPALAYETHVYDGVATAVGMLENANVAAGSVIVLSDGADTGSAVTLEEVAARARSMRVRIFTVGLRSRAFESEPLERLAQRAGGEYSEAASSADLKPIFNALGARLASEYLVRYRSPAGPEQEVQVAVRIRGFDGVATRGYVTPALGDGMQGAYRRSLADTFWQSPLAMLVTSGVAALLLAIGFMIVLRPRTRTVRRRLADFVSLPIPDADRKAARTDVVLSQAERSFEQRAWWGRFKNDLELAEIRTPPIHVIAWTTIVTLVATWLAIVIGGSVLFGVLGAMVPLIVRSAIKRRVDKVRQDFADQLPDNLQVLSSALRAGHSLVGALSVVVEDCPEPSRKEFRRVIADEQLGVSLEDALGVVVDRMDNRDLAHVGLVAALQRETGGNTAEVLDRVSETIRERFELRRLVKTLTTQGRMSRWIVSLLPVALLALITLINPEYMAPLYTHTFGRVLLALAAVMIVCGSLVIRRIVNIRV